MNNLLTKALDFLGGGVFSGVAGLIEKYWPPDVSPEKRAEFDLALTRLQQEQTIKLAEIAQETDAEFNRRLRDMEGTANDLKAVPVIGHLLILLRGAQRPLWGMGALLFDYQVFSGAWTVEEHQNSILLAINLLVLGFLFGERAVRNVAPLLYQFFGKGSEVKAVVDKDR